MFRNFLQGLTAIPGLLGAVCVFAVMYPLGAYASVLPLNAPPAVNLIKNPALADSVSQAGKIVPAHWQSAAWGAASGAMFSYPVSGPDGTHVGAEVSIASYNAADAEQGAAEWYFEDVPVTGGVFYSFSDFYRSDAESHLTVQWTRHDGTQYYETMATLSPTGGAWKSTPKYFFTAPPDAATVSIFHQLQSTGTLAVSDYSLTTAAPPPSESFGVGVVSFTFDDGYLDYYTEAFPILKGASMGGTFYMIPAVTLNYSRYVAADSSDIYMSPAQMLEMQAAGNDMASHTANHCDLVVLYKDPTSWSTQVGCRDHVLSSATTAQKEITDSQKELADMGVSPDNNLAYPFGSFNSRIEALVKDAGFKGARSTDIGYNSATSNLFALRTQNVGINTSFETVKSWIDTAAKHRLWLILTFHNIDSKEKLEQIGAVYGTTPDMLRQIVSYVGMQRALGAIDVQTVGQAISLLPK